MSPDSLLHLVDADDPEQSLSAIHALRVHLAEQERRSVVAARGQGLTWERIASLLGQKRQSVWARYRDLTG